MDSELKRLEEDLRGFAPSPMSGDVLSRMVEAMELWDESESSVKDVEESGKVVAFPAERKSRSSWAPMWGAAAAVAILGAVLGAMLPSNPNNNGGNQIAAMQGVGSVPVLRQASLIPVNVQRKVSSMDAGKVSNKDGLEYQVIRVVRQEEADFRGSDSSANVGLKITRPKVDYYVVPVSY